MKYETSCGAVLYRNTDDTFEYLIIKDRHDNYSFPKGHTKKKEKCINCARREVYEEVGLNIEPEEYFEYTVSYPLNDKTEKIVIYYMADIKDNEPFINDGEVKEILMLPYEKAYELLTFSQLKEVLRTVNNTLVKGMKICCMFQDPEKFNEHNLEFIRSYGSTCNGHDLYTWDEGDRSLYRCRKCGAYVLQQYSEIHMPDATYIDYYPVRDDAHAQEVNETYNGWTLETDYPYRGVLKTFKYDD
ncbi:MAG: NUDIX domain-containing protein [Erysipelotrichaceae bacterium]|nr:NUDIX domain-containing protein [Erysipelotrichaceae bacterium]